MGWVWLSFLLLFGALPLPGAVLSAPVGPHRAFLQNDQDIVLVVTPQRGDAWTRLALRLTGDAAQWKEVAAYNNLGPNLMVGVPVRVPLAMLRPELQAEVLRALFPEDQLSPQGWSHKVIAGGSVEGESLWKIAEWFTGDGANYDAIRKANPKQSLTTKRGDRVLVPSRVLLPQFRARNAILTPEIAEDDPHSGSDTAAPASTPAIVTSNEAIRLEYVKDAGRPYAIYRLQPGEALYSSVGIRFTGRIYARDVNDVVSQIVAFNKIDDVARLPIGYPVKIPMELLTAEWRPSDDPRRIERERAMRESARLATRGRASDLEGVHVILDAGHGGRDVGTAHDGVWESIYVYDVACRVKQLLESRSSATVWMTTRSRGSGCEIPPRNVLEPRSDHEVLTSPRYDLADDPVVGVNLRWYLANSILRKAVKKSPEENVVFLSIHADSLHPSLRGAMVYVPGQRHIQGSYTKKGEAYLARAEVREAPTVSHTEQEALRAEGMSTRLAESLMLAFRNAELNVHPYDPVRDYVVRDGREWVPAIIRYNKVPTRALLEIGNLGNEEDRRLIRTRKHRQQVAEAIYAGIVGIYAGEGAGGLVASGQ